jgi:integrase
LPNLTPRTYEGYEYNTHKYIIPAIGQLAITSLRPPHIQKLCGEHQTKGHYRTAQYIYNTLNKSLNVAVKQGILVRNPCDGVEAPKVPKREMQTLSQSDMHIFLEYARKTQYYTLFYTDLFTGMRRSELLALKWSDVDLILCQISVNRTMHVMRYGTYKGKTVFKQPKTAKSRRMIALSPSNAIVLREHREAQDKLRQQLGLSVTTDDDFVFCRYDGKPYQPCNITHAWGKVARLTGLKGIRLHDARHTHATILLKQGVHPKIVQERLGHANISTTLDTYSHVSPGMQKAAAKGFDDIINKPIINIKRQLIEI